MCSIPYGSMGYMHKYTLPVADDPSGVALGFDFAFFVFGPFAEPPVSGARRFCAGVACVLCWAGGVGVGAVAGTGGG